MAELRENLQSQPSFVVKLQASLDPQGGGEIARGLAELYAYIQERLVEANAEQKLAPLEEALNLLSIVHEGWKEAAHTAMPPPVEPGMTEGSSLVLTL